MDTGIFFYFDNSDDRPLCSFLMDYNTVILMDNGEFNYGTGILVFHYNNPSYSILLVQKYTSNN